MDTPPNTTSATDGTLWRFFNDLAAGNPPGGRLAMTKWVHYFPVYESHFKKYVGMSPRVLEMGVWQGGSLQMWQHFFGEGATVVGIDQYRDCIRLRDAHKLDVHIGTQSDAEFLKRLVDQYGPWDIVIDDASHRTGDQIKSFELFSQPGWMAGNSTYLIEDTHTSEWSDYRDEGQDLYARMFSAVRALNGWHVRGREQDLHIDVGTCSVEAQTVASVSFYDSIIVVERSPRERPQRCASGMMFL
jgi:hypothetical protein